MALRISKIKTDLAAETNGVWVPYEGGSRLLIARIGNPEYEQAVLKLSEPYGQGFRQDADAMRQVTREAMARHILLGWEGIEDDDGVSIPYSFETALKFLTEYRDFYRHVMTEAMNRENFRVKQRQDVVGNLPAASSGVPSSEIPNS